MVLRAARAADRSKHAESALDGPAMAVVLIVEDEPFVRQSAEWVLADLGHSLLLACDLGEAFEHLAHGQQIDALFVDIRLSDLEHGGYDVANRAITLRPDLRVLYTSGAPLHAGMTDRFVLGGQFLQKPYSPDQLELSIMELLQ